MNATDNRGLDSFGKQTHRQQTYAIGLAILCGMFLFVSPALLRGSESPTFDGLDAEYGRQIQPLLAGFCLECHTTAEKQGELDLERFTTLRDVRQDPQVWQKVAQMLDHGEMPPEDSQQPSAEEKQLLRRWVQRYLDAEALANAGDPGPVVLRRLNNAEYTYTTGDLTGVDSLDPAREFPVDGAAGEGFTNTGNSLVMSPSLVQKYLDAAKEVASHAVLLPDGFRFSPGTTRRDWSDETLADIRAIYRRHTSGDTDTSILDRWSGAAATRSTEDDGRVPLTKYFAVLIRHRQALLDNGVDSLVKAVATEEQLNAKYLGHLAEMLVSAQPESALLDSLRRHWLEADGDAAPKLAAEVAAWQNVLWKFNSVGHLGIIQPWQQPVNPLPEFVTLRQPIKSGDEHDDHLVFFLDARAAGTGGENMGVLLQRPRIEFDGRSPILLRDVWSVAGRIERSIDVELQRTDRYLPAVVDLVSSSATAQQVAGQRKLNPALLERWVEYIGLQGRVNRRVTGHLTDKVTKVQGYESINGWGKEATPSLLTNRSDEPISFLTLTVPPRSVTVHPSPTEQAAVRWQSPIDGRIHVEGKVADADDKCGNGATWHVELLREFGVSVLASGTIENGRKGQFGPSRAFDVSKGDMISLAIGPRDQDHACDTTHVELLIREAEGEKRVWNLADQIVDRILKGNPLPDSYGHQDTWHFCAQGQTPPAETVVPPGSALDRWRVAFVASKPAAEMERLAAAVQAVLTGPGEQALDEPDALLRLQLTDWDGPLGWITVAGQVKDGPAIDRSDDDAAIGFDPKLFGRHPNERPIDAASLIVQTPQVLEIRLPGRLVAGGEFIVQAALDPQAGSDGSVQVRLLREKPEASVGLIPGEPLITRPAGKAREATVRAYDDFRSLFPAAMCHARIVPVDEVVTLLLYHREDDHLARLMLDDAEKMQLDRLWDELHYVSQDALRIEVALEQILEFATQDADPSKFDPVRKPIADGAAAFRNRLAESEPAHLDALIEFAGRAYRRPLTARDEKHLRAMYQTLRKEEMTHEEAFRLTLIRVLAAPTFLYRIEERHRLAKPQTQDGEAEAVEERAVTSNDESGVAKAHLVSDFELACRLSYFLRSSMPDEELRGAAAAGRLHDPQTLLAQTRRLLRDQRARRLAVQFACQWLHIRDFDQLDEKSEQYFPEFASLRGDMYEESVRFFTDLFRKDGSIRSILDADHTFLNRELAAHYGIPWVHTSSQANSGPANGYEFDNGADNHWRRFDGVRKFARGGVLAQATVLAKQSGASRTSPILRGNWVSETLLGERLPRPPKGVPQLPETVPEGLTERQLIERHTSDPSCAKCHARIDPYGFALEGFDAIGRSRKMDTSGQEIDTRTVLADGTEIEGVDGLRHYLLTERHDDFVRIFCRRLLGYALGRAVQLSDEPLLDEIMKRLAENDYRVSEAVEAIVLSDQFRKIRAAE